MKKRVQELNQFIIEHGGEDEIKKKLGTKKEEKTDESKLIEAERDKYKNEVKRMKIDSELTKVLLDKGVIPKSIKFVIADVVNDLDVTDKGKVGFKRVKDGEEIIDTAAVKTWADKFVEEHKNFVASDRQPGTDKNFIPKGKEGSDGKRKMTSKEWNAIPDWERAKLIGKVKIV